MERTEIQQQAGDAPSLRRASHKQIVLKATRLGLHVAGGLALAGVYPLLGAKTQLGILRWWSKTVLTILNVRVDSQGVRPDIWNGGMLLVANHISWLDVFALNAVRPSRFVAKSEVRNWPLIGTLCKRTRTIFISRARRADVFEAGRLMAARIAGGECIVVFPEGTSTDGSEVACFHSSLFQSAIEAGRPVIPAAIHYRDGRGNPCKEAAFVGEMTFVQSLFNILSCETLDASLRFLETLDCAGRDRRRLAMESHAAIACAVREYSRRDTKPVFVAGAVSATAHSALPSEHSGAFPLAETAMVRKEA